MFSVSNLSIHFSGDYLFENISFLIGERDRVGLTGKNGAGKTTLLRIIAGEVIAESGSVALPSGCRIGFLPQEMNTQSRETVLNETLKAFSEVNDLEKSIKSLTNEISTRTDFHSDKYMNLVQKLTEANERYMIIGGHTKIADTEKVLIGLGFERSDLARKMNEFSGGWQMRVELAKILLQNPDLLLLDEPTNHLDIESIQWLEEFLSTFSGSLVLVSHDRAFLDNVTRRTIEISLGKIYDYKVSYSEYVIQREERKEIQMAAFNNQQKEIEQIERFVERFRYKSTKSKQVQSRIKMLDKMDIVEVDESDKASIHFRFPPAPHSGKVMVESENVGKHYGEKTVFDHVNFAIIKNDRVAFVGRNGEGKTTLAKIIVGQLDHSGIVKLGHNVSLGYYAQNQADLLNPEKTVFETIDYVATGEMRTKVKSILGSFLFSGEAMDKKVKVLSGGEKSRLALAMLLLSPVNLLVLDEPTNHLDMRSKDILKMALIQYNGTLIIVSHDRDFLQGLTTRVFEFKSKGVRQYIGDIYDFLESRKMQSLKQLEINSKTKPSASKESASSNKDTYEKRRLFEKEVRKVSSRIEKCEAEIMKLEDDIRHKDEILLNPDTYKEFISSKEQYSAYEQMKQSLDRKLEEWEKLHAELDLMKEKENLL